MKILFFYCTLLVGLSWVRFMDGASIKPLTTATNKYLTTSSSICSCPDGTESQCYYESFHLTPSITGNYNFVVYSDMDIDIYLYYVPFNPNQPSKNLIQRGQQNNQEKYVYFTTKLVADDTVILVVTTTNQTPNTLFTINIDGPSTLTIQTDHQLGTQITTTGINHIQKQSLSPLIEHFSWGRAVVEGYKQDFKDLKLFPGGAVSWDWRKTGTRHQPGTQPADVEELFEHNCDIIILSRGMDKRLKTMRETRRFLERHGNVLGKDYFILPSKKAVSKYNELAKAEKRVCAVIHSTC